MRDTSVTQEGELRSSISERLVELKQRFDSIEEAFTNVIGRVCKEPEHEINEQRKIAINPIRTVEEITVGKIYEMLSAINGTKDALSPEQLKVLDKELLEEMEKIFGMMESEFKECEDNLKAAKDMKGVESASNELCEDISSVSRCFKWLATEISGLSDGSGIFIGVPNLYIIADYHKLPRDRIFDHRRVVLNDRQGGGSVYIRFRLLNGDGETFVDEARAFLADLKKTHGARGPSASYGEHDEIEKGTVFISVSVHYRAQQRNAVLSALMPQIRAWMEKHEGIKQTIVPTPPPVNAR